MSCFFYIQTLMKETPSLSFQEKSLWLVFTSLLLAFGLYFFVAFDAVQPNLVANVTPRQTALFGVVIGLTVLLQVAGHIVIALWERRTAKDERDRLIGLKGARWGSYVLVVGVFFALCSALLTEGNFVFAHVLLAFWIVSQLVETGSQLVLHRRGA